jgi:hypothetical protein
VGADRRAALTFLEAHGAGAIEHPGGTLLAHLRRSADLLASWGAPPALTLAGLCHAAYGTDGFPIPLLSTSRRHHLVEVIGTTAEAIVYFYASCDRAVFLPQLGRHDPPWFRDRFTRAEFPPEAEMVRQFVELTIANELDIAAHSAAFAQAQGPALADLFGRCRELASSAANAAMDRFLCPRPA